MNGSGRGLCRKLSIISDQIRGNGFRPKLPKHRRHLSAVIRAVIRKMLQQLPERLRLRRAGKAFVVNRTQEIVPGERRRKIHEVAVNFFESLAYDLHIRKIRRC